MDECTLAVSKIKINKSQGLDGICIEFYKKFWPVVGRLLVDVFNDSYSIDAEGILPDSERTAVMTLIFKKGEEDEIGNFRPISLTNVDYRILAFVLSNRLQNIIPSIVNTDQTAYIKGRYMGQNIRLLLDIINNYNTKDKQGFIMTLDFTKAFDTLERNFMFKVMKFFNFGESFIKWMKLLYGEPISYIKNNGHLSERISISRGIRQGCPVSGLLFILAVEVLALRIRSSIRLKGLPIGNKHIKISQYADDGVLYLNDKDEIGCAINIISNCGNVAGTLLNIDKCEGMCLGSFNTNMVLKKIFREVYDTASITSSRPNSIYNLCKLCRDLLDNCIVPPATNYLPLFSSACQSVWPQSQLMFDRLLGHSSICNKFQTGIRLIPIWLPHNCPLPSSLKVVGSRPQIATNNLQPPVSCW